MSAVSAVHSSSVPPLMEMSQSGQVPLWGGGKGQTERRGRGEGGLGLTSTPFSRRCAGRRRLQPVGREGEVEGRGIDVVSLTQMALLLENEEPDPRVAVQKLYTWNTPPSCRRGTR